MDEEQQRVWLLEVGVEELRRRLIAAETQLMEQRVAFQKRIGSLERFERDAKFYLCCLAAMLIGLSVTVHYGQERAREIGTMIAILMALGICTYATYRGAKALYDRFVRN